MKKIILLFTITIFIFGCSTIPTNTSDFSLDKVKVIHKEAKELNQKQASFIYFGTGRINRLILQNFDSEFYSESFEYDKITIFGMYNEYLKITPGLHYLSFESFPIAKGKSYAKWDISIRFNFLPGYVYALDHEYDRESGQRIDVLYWEIGSEEMLRDKIEL